MKKIQFIRRYIRDNAPEIFDLSDIRGMSAREKGRLWEVLNAADQEWDRLTAVSVAAASLSQLYAVCTPVNNAPESVYVDPETVPNKHYKK